MQMFLFCEPWSILRRLSVWKHDQAGPGSRVAGLQCEELFVGGGVEAMQLGGQR